MLLRTAVFLGVAAAGLITTGNGIEGGTPTTPGAPGAGGAPGPAAGPGPNLAAGPGGSPGRCPRRPTGCAP